MAIFNPTAAGALGPNYVGATVESATSDTVYDQRLVQAGQFGLQTMNELMGISASNPGGQLMNVAYTMTAFTGMLGQPVRLDPNNDVSVLPANSLTAPNAQVFGFINAISASDPTKCYVCFVCRIASSGLTRGAPVYLTDAGAYGAAAGTVTRQLGLATSATTAIISSLSSLVGL